MKKIVKMVILQNLPEVMDSDALATYCKHAAKNIEVGIPDLWIACECERGQGSAKAMARWKNGARQRFATRLAKALVASRSGALARELIADYGYRLPQEITTNSWRLIILEDGRGQYTPTRGSMIIKSPMEVRELLQKSLPEFSPSGQEKVQWILHWLGFIK